MGIARAILGRFINRLPRDYLSRYANVLTWENKSRNMEGIILSVRSDENERRHPQNDSNARRFGPSTVHFEQSASNQITFFFKTFLTLIGAFFDALSSSPIR